MRYFRRLYWVTECVDGSSGQVRGVYTSIPDLVDKGLVWFKKNDMQSKLRLTLVKLDSVGDPLGSWTGPDFENLEEDVRRYVLSEDFSEDESKDLIENLISMAH